MTRMKNGQAPFVRNANGDWEPLQLHHVGRETGKMIEVTRSQNRYNPSTGGPLHCPVVGRLKAMSDISSGKSSTPALTRTQILNLQSSIEPALAPLSMLPNINISSN